MSVAGIWDTWRPGTPLQSRSFSILTTAANRFMRDIHNRMPVILDNASLGRLAQSRNSRAGGTAAVDEAMPG
jgi:putative SOS response-associated peptidase YedK